MRVVIKLEQHERRELKSAQGKQGGEAELDVHGIQLNYKIKTYYSRKKLLWFMVVKIRGLFFYRSSWLLLTVVDRSGGL